MSHTVLDTVTRDTTRQKIKYRRADTGQRVPKALELTSATCQVSCHAAPLSSISVAIRCVRPKMELQSVWSVEGVVTWRRRFAGAR